MVHEILKEIPCLDLEKFILLDLSLIMSVSEEELQSRAKKVFDALNTMLEEEDNRWRENVSFWKCVIEMALWFPLH